MRWLPQYAKSTNSASNTLPCRAQGAGRSRRHTGTMNTNDKPYSPRRALLEEAANIVDGDRNAQYGDPTDDFRRTAIYWSTHAGGVFRRKLAERHHDIYVPPTWLLELVDTLFDPHDIAIMMGQLKASRLAWSPTKRDHWTDSAGYAACGFNCIEHPT